MITFLPGNSRFRPERDGGGPLRPRLAHSAGTRLACFCLFGLALCLAGAASTAVRGMSAPAPYEPTIVGSTAEPLPPEPQIPITKSTRTAKSVSGDTPPPPPKPAAPVKPSTSKAKPSTPSTPAKPASPPNPKPAAAKTEEVVPPAPKSSAERFWIRDRDGRRVVGRVYSEWKGRYAVVLPDGEIGFADGVAPTDEPFRPLSMAELEAQLHEKDYARFKVLRTKHYLVFWNGSSRFAQASADLLEDLYTKLSTALLRKGFSVHQAEFPLVAVIFATEAEFRAHKKVPPQVQAYYEILSNRIFMYEASTRDHASPEVAMLRKPQTVAHEGSHQILQNIGIQPRLADWPMWLVEGLADYCSPPKITKNGADWAGLNQINPLHMATIRDLDDPLSALVPGSNVEPIRRTPGESWIKTLVSKEDLTPTDYALSWALTHYLANKRLPEFLQYLTDMSKRPPLERRDAEEHLRDFEKFFGKATPKADGVVASYLARIKKFDALPYYAVFLEQPLPAGGVRRAAMVSQSPQMIQQWIDQVSSPRGGVPQWRIFPHPTRARADLAAHEWINASR